MSFSEIRGVDPAQILHLILGYLELLGDKEEVNTLIFEGPSASS